MKATSSLASPPPPAPPPAPAPVPPLTRGVTCASLLSAPGTTTAAAAGAAKSARRSDCGAADGADTRLKWRKWKLKAKLESSQSYCSVKRLVPGAFNSGFFGTTCTALPSAGAAAMAATARRCRRARPLRAPRRRRRAPTAGASGCLPPARAPSAAPVPPPPRYCCPAGRD